MGKIGRIFNLLLKAHLKTAVVVFIILWAGLFVPLASTMSAPSIAWTQTYPDVVGPGRGVLQTIDGGYLLLFAGSQGSTFLLKTDPSGNPQWNRTYAATLSGYSQKIIETADGGYAIAAEYQHSYFLLKIDASGNQEWNKSYTGFKHSAEMLIQTRDEGYALAGTSGLVKTDSQGNVEWYKALGECIPKSLIQTSDSGYAIAGDFNFNLMMLDSNGTLLWSRTYVQRDMNEVYTVVQTSDRGFALSGYMWQRIGVGNAYLALLKTDATGNPQWTQYYGEGVAVSMTKTSDGGFALAYVNRLVKADVNGIEEWEIGVGGNVIQTQDGGYAVAGSVKINENTWVRGLTKLNRDPGLLTVSPTPTTSPTSSAPSSSTSNPDSILYLPAEIIVAVVVVAAVVIAGSAVLISKMKRA